MITINRTMRRTPADMEGATAVPAVIRRRPVGWLAVLVAATVVGGPVVADPVLVAAAAGTQVSPADQAKILKTHNDARTEVGLPPLVWDDGLASAAQVWVDRLVAENGGNLDHGSGDRAKGIPPHPLSAGAKGQGENLNGGRAAGDMAVGWYGEKSMFDPNVPYVFDPKNGHYSQMIWGKTTKIGCGTAAGGPNRVVNGCRYDPPGNFGGQLPLDTGSGVVKPLPPPVGTQGGGAQGGTSGGTQSGGTQAGGAPQILSSTATRLPCGSVTRSPDDQGGDVTIDIVNNSSVPVTISWLNREGQKELPVTANPNGTATLNTFAGDIWVAEANGTCITALEGAGTITFG